MSIIRPLGSYTFLWCFLKKVATDETEVCLLGELLQLLIKILRYAYSSLSSWGGGRHMEVEQTKYPVLAAALNVK